MLFFLLLMSPLLGLLANMIRTSGLPLLRVVALGAIGGVCGTVIAFVAWIPVWFFGSLFGLGTVGEASDFVPLLRGMCRVCCLLGPFVAVWFFHHRMLTEKEKDRLR